MEFSAKQQKGLKTRHAALKSGTIRLSICVLCFFYSRRVKSLSYKPKVRVLYISLVSSNARRVSSHCNTRLRLV